MHRRVNAHLDLSGLPSTRQMKSRVRTDLGVECCHINLHSTAQTNIPALLSSTDHSDKSEISQREFKRKPYQISSPVSKKSVGKGLRLEGIRESGLSADARLPRHIVPIGMA